MPRKYNICFARLQRLKVQGTLNTELKVWLKKHTCRIIRRLQISQFNKTRERKRGLSNWCCLGQYPFEAVLFLNISVKGQ